MSRKIKLGEHTWGIVTDDQFYCTHGNWSGTLTLNDDGTCKVDAGRSVIEYRSYTWDAVLEGDDVQTNRP